VTAKGVSVALAGGLGNQLFQWATGYSLSQRLNAPLTLDGSEIERFDKSLSPRKFELDYFSISGGESCSGILGKALRWASQIGISAEEEFRESGFQYDPKIESAQPGTRLVGYFQSWRYFDNYESEIREILAAGATPKPDSHELRQKLERKSWIGVHVRRGDYLNFPEVFSSLDSGYYSRALDQLDVGGTDEIVVFSENADDAKELVPQGTIFADSTEVSHPGDVVMLLANAKHVVGANSSLSWWGAYLNDQRGAKRVFPSRWFGPKGWPTNDLLPKKWITV